MQTWMSGITFIYITLVTYIIGNLLGLLHYISYINRITLRRLLVGRATTVILCPTYQVGHPSVGDDPSVGSGGGGDGGGRGRECKCLSSQRSVVR